MQCLAPVDALKLGVLHLAQGVLLAGCIVQRIHGEMGDRALLAGLLLVAKVGGGGVAQLLHALLRGGDVDGAGLAPGVGGEQAQRAVDAAVDVVLAHAVFLEVAHVVPYGEGAAGDLRVAGRDLEAADLVDLVVVAGVLVEVVIVVAGVGNYVEHAVLAVDQLEAKVVHGFHVRPAGIP